MSAKRRILVADDDSGIRDLIRTRLQLAGFEVHIARNGAEALSHAMAVRPDAMVLDINMPEMDGFEVLSAMRSASTTMVPVLVLTARHAASDVQRAIGLGAKDYLAKPFSEAQLLARVGRLLRAPINMPN
jgi:DNA-binding response OmpR family regulator